MMDFIRPSQRIHTPLPQWIYDIISAGVLFGVVMVLLLTATN